MTEQNAFGRILSANIRECVVGYRTGESEIPIFGSLVRIPVSQKPQLEIIGIVTDIQMEEDGFLRQIAANKHISEEVMADARANRNVPIVLRILFVGHQLNGQISHLLPPRPPLTLDAIFRCTEAETAAFTVHGTFGYLRHILAVPNQAPAELLAAHIRQTAKAQFGQGYPAWTADAIEEIITLLRDDYAGLTAALSSIADADITFESEEVGNV